MISPGVRESRASALPAECPPVSVSGGSSHKPVPEGTERAMKPDEMGTFSLLHYCPLSIIAVWFPGKPAQGQNRDKTPPKEWSALWDKLSQTIVK